MLNTGSKIIAINLAFAQKLGIYIQKINIEAWKINSSIFKIFGIVITDFQMKNKNGILRFFHEIFLLADTYFEIILRKSFLKISNADVLFSEKTLT